MFGKSYDMGFKMNSNIILVNCIVSTINKLANILWNEPEDIISIKEQLSTHFASDYNEDYIEPALEWLIYTNWIEKRRGFFCLTVKGRNELPLFSPEMVFSKHVSA
jgi:hypothetical protein